MCASLLAGSIVESVLLAGIVAQVLAVMACRQVGSCPKGSLVGAGSAPPEEELDEEELEDELDEEELEELDDELEELDVPPPPAAP